MEGLSACFLTELDRTSYDVVLWLIFKLVQQSGVVEGGKKRRKKGPPPPMQQPLSRPKDARRSVQVEGYWIACGDSVSPRVQEGYILTKTVRRNLRDVARVVALSKLPVLLQGETASGKTSLIR